MSVWGTISCNLKLRGFSREPGLNHFAPRGRSSSRLGIDRPDLPNRSAYTLEPGRPTPGRPSLLRSPIAVAQSTGILTGFPSTTPVGLALGVDSPCADERCAGTLGFTACGLFTRIIVTHVSIRTSDTSSGSYDPPSQAYGTLPYHADQVCVRSFGKPLSPVTSSARDN